ncbi:MAG: DUF2073 domain-containing protein [Halobacteriota archaeon]|nr:DUF2073 domain-containing protein [Halobacteriota archaeon]MDY6958424.1 DUF2073 domain-containing protein [Halobacteriota archaeon]
MQGVQLDLISEDRLSSMTSMEKIRMILDGVQRGNIIVLEKGLTPEEETTLIEITMTEIVQDEFTGIEIESYPYKQKTINWLGKIMGKPNMQSRLTVIGPANQLVTIKKDEDFISAIVSSGPFKKRVSNAIKRG